MGKTNQPLPKISIAADGRSFVTDEGKPFVPMGVNYYRPETGWTPQVWKQFNADATRKDFARMKDLGVNCVRVFLTFGSFYTDPGELRSEGLAKFDQFLSVAEEFGIYVHPTGPEFWEGPPNWNPVVIGDEGTIRAQEAYWKLFATRYRGRHVIFAYDLKNEPRVPWNNHVLISRWNAWLEKKYGTIEKLQKSWGTTNALQFGRIALLTEKESLNSRDLLDYQSFREGIADEWTQRQVAAIKSVDPEALTTIGFLQTSVPTRFWHGISDYTAFRPSRQAKFLDFLEIHFYPSERGGYGYLNEEEELLNLAYLEGIVREVAFPGKPVVLGEFGWYGGKEKPKFDNGTHPLGTEGQQASYLRHVIETSSGFVTGWLNWGFYDQPGATDCSELSGLLTVSGDIKEWGKTFHELSVQLSGKNIQPRPIGPRPTFDWDAAVTSWGASEEFRKQYFKAFVEDRRTNGQNHSKQIQR